MSERHNLDPTLLSRPEDWVKIQAQFWIDTTREEFVSRLARDLPRDWMLPESDVKAVWVAGFRIEALREGLFDGRKKLDLLGLRLLLGSGWLPYVDTSSMRPAVSSEGKVEVVGEPRPNALTSENYLLVIAPLLQNPRAEDVDAESCRVKVEVVLGLLRGLIGRNIAWERLYDNIYDLQDGSTSVFPGLVENPKWHGSPNVSNQNLMRLSNVAEALELLPVAERNRTELSLRWFSQSFESGEVDDFLRLWIALETLAMNRDAKVTPVVNHLASAYRISYPEAVRTFEVGRLQGLRHRIVHKGEQSSVSRAIVLYLESVYLDVLEHKLGLPSLRRAEDTKQDKAAGVIEQLKQRYSGAD